MSTLATYERAEIPKLAPDTAQKINALHADAQRAAHESRKKLDSAAVAAWQAGKLLLEAKASIVRHGGRSAWVPWVEAKFDGGIRTAQRYMKLARQLPEAPKPDGLSLRQIYFRLGIATEPKKERPDGAQERIWMIPKHIILAEKLVVILRKSQGTIRPQGMETLFAQLQSLFAAAKQTAA